MTRREQLLQSVLFELLLIAIIVPLVSGLGLLGLDVPAERALIVALVGSAGALLVAYFYNLAFDRLFGGNRVARRVRTRVFHALGFEFTLLLGFLPFLMWYLSLSFVDALLLDLALVGVTVIYTYFFHWVYDNVRYHWLKRRAALEREA